MYRIDSTTKQLTNANIKYRKVKNIQKTKLQEHKIKKGRLKPKGIVQTMASPSSPALLLSL